MKTCRFMALLLVVILASVNLSGCQTLRRKFIRKKDNVKEPELFLDLKDYPDAPTKDMFHQHYLYVKGWVDELVIQLETGSNHKRMRYSIDMAINSLDQIKSYLNSEGKGQLETLYLQFLELKKKVYDSYQVTSNGNRLAKKANKLKRSFAKQFSYDDISHLLGGN